MTTNRKSIIFNVSECEQRKSKIQPLSREHSEARNTTNIITAKRTENKAKSLVEYGKQRDE